MAGIAIGPFTPGFVADVGLAAQLAEIGVMLPMFGVGLLFSLSDLMAVRRIAVPGAIVQTVAAVLLGMDMATLWAWKLGASLVFGLCLSVASTVVLLRAMEDCGVLKSINGQIAAGWLIVEDLVRVLVRTSAIRRACRSSVRAYRHRACGTSLLQALRPIARPVRLDRAWPSVAARGRRRGHTGLEIVSGSARPNTRALTGSVRPACAAGWRR